MQPGATITWWGCASVEIAIGGRCLVIDPYLEPADAEPHYIFLTHEHYDHCHEPTLEALTSRATFERMFSPEACLANSVLHSPVCDDPRDLSFVPEQKLTTLWPKFTVSGQAFPGPVECEVDEFVIETVESGEQATHYRRPGANPWFDLPGRRTRTGEFPTIGYVITHVETGLTFYHPGDLEKTFDSQRELRGRIDYLFWPTPKLEGLELTFIDNIQPQYVIPIHYRSYEPDFPIPLTIDPEDVTAADPFTGARLPGADDAVYDSDIRSMVENHWYPTPARPFEHIQSVAEKLDGISEMLLLKAGKPYEIFSCSGGR